MMNRAILTTACVALAFGGFGCSNSVRYMTANHWLTPPNGGGEAVATSEGPTEKKESPPASTPAPAPNAKPGGGARVLYLTYWEGSCSGGFLGFGKGCSKGDSRVKRCEVQPDNTLKCVDEKEIDKALSTSN